MCGILFTNFDITSLNMKYVIEFLQKRGPDLTKIKKIREYTFVHTLLSMTGPLTEQPFFNKDNSIICIFNGEIYNFEKFGKFRSDGECLIPLYEKYGDKFISKLDGEFAIVLVDFNKNKLILSTDIFGTRPLWIGFDEKKFGISTYKSCLNRINLQNNFQVLANKTYIIDLINVKIIEEKRVHTFDLKQYKTNFDDWNRAFSKSIKKRTKYAKCGIFIGLSSGYDSGAIACELTKQKVNFTAYSIANVEDKEVLNERSKIVKNCKKINLERESFLEARDFLKKNAEEYKLNIDNGEKEEYNNLINTINYDKNKANQLLKVFNFRKDGQILTDDNGEKEIYNNLINTIKYNENKANQLLEVFNFRKDSQILTDDNGAIGCSYICSLAIKKNQKIYLSGSGADEIFSDYGFNRIKYFNHSSIGGYFPENLSIVFPWKNFFHNTQRAYLMKEEHIAGAYGIEGRYPFLDKYVVQEFLWLSPELKNKNYKSPLYNYLTINNFAFEKNQKTGFGCGFSSKSNNNNNTNIEYQILSENEINNSKNKKVTDIDCDKKKINFNNYIRKSYENYYIIDKKKINHIKKKLYTVPIDINIPGIKYYNKCKFYLLENNIPIGKHEFYHNNIAENGNGLYNFWTSNTLYFSSSDGSDPRTNGYEYAIDKIQTNYYK